MILAKQSAAPLGLEVDEVCRRYADLKSRLNNGTPEQAVEFLNSYGGNLRLDGTTADRSVRTLVEHGDVVSVAQ